MDRLESKLKKFTASKSKDFPEFLLVTCGHEDCPSVVGDRPFLVHGRTWLRPVRLTAHRTGIPYTVRGRACPYCFRTGLLPGRREIG